MEKAAFTLVVPFQMIMFDVFVNAPAEPSFSEQNEFGQAFLPEGTHPALGESVRFGLLGGRANGRIALGPQEIQKRSAEFCIPIMKKANPLV